MELKPKYNIGDVVLYPSASYIPVRDGCSDCLESGKAILTLGTKESIEVNCPTCKGVGNIQRHDWKCCINTMVVGLIKYDSSEGFSYMCNETGIGSGAVYKEHKLFSDTHLAETVGSQEALNRMKSIAKQNLTNKKPFDRINEMLETLGYTRNQSARQKAKFISWANSANLDETQTNV